MSTKNAWQISIAISGIFVAILSGLWWRMARYDNSDSLYDTDCHKRCAGIPLQDCNCIEQSAQLKDQATVTR